MAAALKLVSYNPNPLPHARLDEKTLHSLADQLTAQVRAGRNERGSAASAYRLSPFDIAIVATWMAKAGLGEEQILRAVGC